MYKSVLPLLFCMALAEVSQGRINAATAMSGYWDEPSIWSDGVVPSGEAFVEIAIGHTVIIRGSCHTQGMIISGTLVVSVTGVLEVGAANRSDVLVRGLLEVFGLIVGAEGSQVHSSGGRIVFRNGSTYQHLYRAQEGVIPQADWEAQSTLAILGYTTAAQATPQGGWGQRFGNIDWDTPAQVVAFDLRGTLGSLQGDLKMLSTGSAYLLLSSSPGAGSLSIAGDVILSGGSLELTNSPSGKFVLSCRDLVCDIPGYLSLATDGEGTIDIARHINVSHGTIRETGTATGNFLFTGSRRHYLRRGADGEQGVFQGRINYVVSIADTLDLGTAVLANGTGNSNANALILDGTLMLGSLDELGALQHNTTGGNLRTALSRRVFAPSCRIIYNGEAPQFMGNAGPAAAAATTYINNAMGVVVSSNAALTGKLILKQGAFYIGTGRTLTLSGGVDFAGGFIDGSATATLIVDDALASPGTLEFHPSGNTRLGNLTVNRAGELKLLTPLTLSVQLNLVTGSLVNDDFLFLEHDATIVRWPEGRLTGQRVRVIADGQFNVVYKSASPEQGPFARITPGLELPDDAHSLRSLKIQAAQKADTILLAHDVTINHGLNMERGVLYAGNHIIDFKGPLWIDDTGNFGHGTGMVVFSDSAWVGGTTNSRFYSIRVLPGAYLGFTRNTTIAGDIDFRSGSRVSAKGIIFTLDGSVLQNISGSGAVVGGITISKSGAGVQLVSPLTLSGVLRFNAPSRNIEFKSDGFLTLRSVSDTVGESETNGMIYRLLDGNTVSGAVTVDRFMSGEGRIYRYLSSPVNYATVASWKDDFSITGNFKDPASGGTICGYKIIPREPSLYYYDEVLAAYVAYPSAGRASGESRIETGRGYAAFIRQCASPTVVDVTGEVNQQQINLPVSYTPNVNSNLSGWNLVGNPYPCTIDWDVTAQGWLKRNISPAIAILDNGGGGFFRYWDGESSGILEGRIAIGQAFWVRATAPNPSLTIREGVKVTQQAEFYRRRKSPTGVLALHLKHGPYVDDAYVKVREGAQDELDSLDAPKLENALYDLAIQSADSVLMAINTVGTIACSQTMALVVKDLQPGDYAFDLETAGVFTEYNIVLRDKFLNDAIRLTPGNPYLFSVTGEEGSFKRDRFELLWTRLQEPGRIRQQTYVLCDSEVIEISVEGASHGIIYELWRDTVRFSPSLSVAAADLPVGEHQFKVKWIAKCASEFMVEEVRVIRQRRDSIAITLHDGNLLCVQGQGSGEWTWAGEVIQVDESCIRALEPGTYTYRSLSGGCPTHAAIDYTPKSALVSFFPNPVGQGYLSVFADFQEIQSMALMDALGAKTVIFDLANIQNQKMGIFEVSNLKPGIYFLKVIHRGGGENVYKVVRE
jgi:hypothetical protein